VLYANILTLALIQSVVIYLWPTYGNKMFRFLRGQLLLYVVIRSVKLDSEAHIYWPQFNLFEFAINRFLMELFKTSDIQIIDRCRDFFRMTLPMPTYLIVTRIAQVQWYLVLQSISLILTWMYSLVYVCFHFICLFLYLLNYLQVPVFG